jgi:hypothetical protein
MEATMNTLTDNERLAKKIKLIEKLDKLLLATAELRAQAEGMEAILEEAHRIPEAA